VNFRNQSAAIKDNEHMHAPVTAPWALPLAQSCRVTSVAQERSLPVVASVTLVHVVALFWMLNPLQSPAPQQPVLSFTVTLMDLSSSPNSISSAASAASSPAEKSEPKKIVEDVTPEAMSAKPKMAAKTKTNPQPKKNAALSHNSQAQTAVLAPLTPAQFDAAYLQNPKPDYPPLSRRMGEQGNVTLSVYVSEEGRAENIHLKKSSGFTRLDNAALDAVKRWRFISAKQGERVVASWVQVPVKFILE